MGFMRNIHRKRPRTKRGRENTLISTLSRDKRNDRRVRTKNFILSDRHENKIQAMPILWYATQ